MVREKVGFCARMFNSLHLYHACIKIRELSFECKGLGVLKPSEGNVTFREPMKG